MADCCDLECIPNKISPSSLNLLITIVNQKNTICPGHCDDKFCEFVSAKKGKLLNKKSQEVAYLDSYFPVTYNGSTSEKTVRSWNCTMFSANG